MLTLCTLLKLFPLLRTLFVHYLNCFTLFKHYHVCKHPGGLTSLMYQRSGNCISDDKDTIIAIMMIMMPFDQKQKTDTSKFFWDQQPSFLHVKKPVFLFADIGTQLWWSLHLFSLSLHSKVQHFNRRPFPIISFFSHSSAHDCESWNQS